MPENKSTDKYANLGVSSGKEAVHAATKDNSKGLFPYSFCKIEKIPGWTNEFRRWFGQDKVDIMHADGAGTKTALAYIYWKETGDMSVWRGVVQDSIVMNLDDVLCIGGASGRLRLASNIDRNTFRIPDEVVAELIRGENVFVDNMRKYGVNIVGQVGETADVPDLVRTVVINNTLYCEMPRKNVINNAKINAGDYIIGLSSSGQAKYETEYNGGMGSNGLTLGRHGVFSSEYREKYPETYEELLGDKAYTGSKKLTDKIKIDGFGEIDIAKLVLSPTRTYAPVFALLHKEGLAKILSGAVHNSGGGQTKVLKYLSRPLSIVKDNLFPVPPLFEMIWSEVEADLRKTEKEDLPKKINEARRNMYKTFNMGNRMELYTPYRLGAAEIMDAAKSQGVDAKIIGRVEAREKGNSRVLINVARNQQYVYE